MGGSGALGAETDSPAAPGALREWELQTVTHPTRPPLASSPVRSGDILLHLLVSVIIHLLPCRSSLLPGTPLGPAGGPDLFPSER